MLYKTIERVSLYLSSLQQTSIQLNLLTHAKTHTAGLSIYLLRCRASICLPSLTHACHTLSI